MALNIGSLFTRGKNLRFSFEGKNIGTGQVVRGEVVADNEEDARKRILRRGVEPLRVNKVKVARRKRITQEDITIFTRQLATMMKAGLPLMQAFEIVARGHSNLAMTELLMQIHDDVGQGNALGKSFAKHPKYFDYFYCNLITAGETGGVLESILNKLSLYKEKTQSIKKKVKSALTYPVVIGITAIGLVFLMMLFVLPEFGKVYTGMGAELPGLTQFMMNTSDFIVEYAVVIVLSTIAFCFLSYKWYKKSYSLQKRLDIVSLKLPIFGSIIRKAVIARWSRTAATLFAAGVPLAEVLDSVAGVSGNILYEEATHDIRSKVVQGLSLTSSMQGTELFPNIVLQMTAIGEESGSLDDMLNKVAEFYEEDVDNAVEQLSALMEPIVMIVLGGTVGIILISVYLPLFNIGNAVG